MYALDKSSFGAVQGIFSQVLSTILIWFFAFKYVWDLAGKPEMNKNYQRNLKDDPSWLPLGPDHRQNGDGTKRFQKGYLAYAGSGTNSRSNQLIVALGDNGRLGGGSPWEVPWGLET